MKAVYRIAEGNHSFVELMRRDLRLKAEYAWYRVAGTAKNGEIQTLCVELEIDTSVRPLRSDRGDHTVEAMDFDLFHSRNPVCVTPPFRTIFVEGEERARLTISCRNVDRLSILGFSECEVETAPAFVGCHSRRERIEN